VTDSSPALVDRVRCVPAEGVGDPPLLLAPPAAELRAPPPVHPAKGGFSGRTTRRCAVRQDLSLTVESAGLCPGDRRQRSLGRYLEPAHRETRDLATSVPARPSHDRRPRARARTMAPVRLPGPRAHTGVAPDGATRSRPPRTESTRSQRPRSRLASIPVLLPPGVIALPHEARDCFGEVVADG
jgi:hypothetical protein